MLGFFDVHKTNAVCPEAEYAAYLANEAAYSIYPDPVTVVRKTYLDCLGAMLWPQRNDSGGWVGGPA